MTREQEAWLAAVFGGDLEAALAWLDGAAALGVPETSLRLVCK